MSLDEVGQFRTVADYIDATGDEAESWIGLEPNNDKPV